MKMTEKEILDYNKRCAEFLGCKIDFNVADWSKYDDKLLTEHWNNNDKTYVDTPKGEGLRWYRVKHRGNFYQLFTDFTYQKLKESDVELGGEYNGKYYKLKNMQFHLDWNWIMELVEAIEKLGYKFQLGWNITTLISLVPKTPVKISLIESENRKEAVVQAINKFLIWYNNEKSN